jgi:hypothetical protein
MLQDTKYLCIFRSKLTGWYQPKKNYMRERTLQMRAPMEACKHIHSNTLQK